jgi:hypothetical protein
MQRTWCSDPSSRLKAVDIVKILNVAFDGPLEQDGTAELAAKMAKAPAPEEQNTAADLLIEAKRRFAKKQFVEAMVALRKVFGLMAALWMRSSCCQNV